MELKAFVEIDENNLMSNNKNFKNITQKLNHDLHEQKVNGIARDFKNHMK